MIYDHVGGRLSELDEAVVAHVPPGGNWRDLPPDFPSKRVKQIRTSAAAGEGSRSTYYGRLRSDRPSYTVSTYFNRPGNGCYIHPQADRLITVREAARLQSFPDSFRFCGRGRARFILVGNAVPPLLAFHIARGIAPGPVIDLFSGAGGMSLGFEWAGSQVVAAIDNSEAAVATARANGLDESVAFAADLGDPAELRRVVNHLKSRLDGRPSAVVGGPPCQGFSTAGKWISSDPRNLLVFAFMDAVESLRPQHVVMENVAALLWKRGRPVLDALRQRLSAMGYATSVGLLHAESFGVPQLRRRLVLLGARGTAPSWPMPIKPLSPPSYPRWQAGSDCAPPGVPVTVGDAIGDLPLIAGTDPDAPLSYGGPAESQFQRWARGELAVEDLVGFARRVETSEQLVLEDAA